MNYTAPRIMFWMRAYPLRGQVGGDWALELERFLGPVKWHRAYRRVSFGAQKPVFRIHDILGWIRIRGSMPLTNGSGSCYFVIDLQDASKNLIFNTIFSANYFLKVHLHHFSKIKSQKESQNRRNQGFSYFFFMMIEGSGSGSIPLTSGSGSGSGTLPKTQEF
jgi:hypothetical protein